MSCEWQREEIHEDKSRPELSAVVSLGETTTVEEQNRLDYRKSECYGTGGGVLLCFVACLTWTTRPREDGALFPQDRSPMANRSFLLCQRWLKKVFPSLSILSISLPAFSAHFRCPSTATVFSWLLHASNISLYLPSTFPNSVMYNSLSFSYSEHSATT